MVKKSATRTSSLSSSGKLGAAPLVLYLSDFEAEVILGVAETDVADERTEHLHVTRQFAIDDLPDDEVAEQTAEVFVPRIAQETARVGQHADKPAEQTEVGQRVGCLLNAKRIRMLKLETTISAETGAIHGLTLAQEREMFRKVSFEQLRVQLSVPLENIQNARLEPRIGQHLAERDMQELPPRDFIKKDLFVTVARILW